MIPWTWQVDPNIKFCLGLGGMLKWNDIMFEFFQCYKPKSLQQLHMILWG